MTPLSLSFKDSLLNCLLIAPVYKDFFKSVRNPVVTCYQVVISKKYFLKFIASMATLIFNGYKNNFNMFNKFTHIYEHFYVCLLYISASQFSVESINFITRIKDMSSCSLELKIQGAQFDHK